MALLLPQDQGLVQLTLLGAGELLPSAVNPNEAEAPAPRDPLNEAFLTVIAPLVPELVPFHRLWMVTPLGRVRCTVHPLIAEEPAVTVTAPLNPPCQLLDTE